MSSLTDALDAHVSSLKTFAGEAVTYKRGSSNSVAVTAIPAQSTFDDVASSGEVRAQVKVADWLIAPADLVIGGSAVEPERGDRIERASGEVFEVYPGTEIEAWQWSDAANKTFYRVHTVRRVAS